MNILKTKEKETLIRMLKDAYGDVKEEQFINALADSPEEKTELILLAYSLKNIPQTQQKTVMITKCSSKIQLVKAIKEIATVGLAEAKDYADSLFPTNGICYPVKIGTDCAISIEQWEEIAKQLTKSLESGFEWGYIQYN